MSEKKDKAHFMESFDNETDRSIETISQKMAAGAETYRTPGKQNENFKFTPQKRKFFPKPPTPTANSLSAANA